MDIYPVVCFKVDGSDAESFLGPESKEDVNIDNRVIGLTENDNSRNKESGVLFTINEINLAKDETMGDDMSDISIDDVKPELLTCSHNEIQIIHDESAHCSKDDSSSPVIILDDSAPSSPAAFSELEKMYDIPAGDQFTMDDVSSQSYKVNTALNKIDNDRAYPVPEVKILEDNVTQVGCLYRVLSMGMFHSPNKHNYVRKLIVSNIVNNWEHYKDIISQNTNAYDVEIKNSNDYKSYMSVSGRQGGDLELRVATRIFNIYIDIINSHEKYMTRYGSVLWVKKQIIIYYTPACATSPCRYDIILNSDIVNYGMIQARYIGTNVEHRIKPPKQNVKETTSKKNSSGIKKDTSTKKSSKYMPRVTKSILQKVLTSGYKTKMKSKKMNYLSYHTPKLDNFGTDSSDIGEYQNTDEITLTPAENKQLIEINLCNDKPNNVSSSNPYQYSDNKSENTTNLLKNKDRQAIFVRINGGGTVSFVKSNRTGAKNTKINKMLSDYLDDGESISSPQQLFLPT